MDISKYLMESKIDPSSVEPFYLQIAKIITRKIIDNTLPKGTKLPPERELGGLFGVSRTTAINAYRQLEQEGLVITKVGSGTYVAETSTSPSHIPQVPWSQLFVPYPQTPMSSILRDLVSTRFSTDIISLATGMPDPAFYPIDTFRELFRSHSSQTDTADFGYIATEGYLPLRHSIAKLLNDKGVQTTWDKTLILSGSQQGLYLVSKVMLERGDYVVVESPTYIGAIQIFQAIGAKVLILPVSDTLPLDVLEDYLIRYRPKMFYTIPTYQNPTGRVLTDQQRRDLLQLAMRRRLVIVEDDPYGELFYEEKPPLSLKAMDPFDGVIYIGTFSKIITPGLRIGYLTGHPALINRLALEKQYIDLHSNNFTQWLVHLFVENGYLEEHLSFVRKEYKKRRDSLVKAVRRYLGNYLAFQVPGGGFYLWCRLQTPLSAGKLLHEAIKCGVFYVPGEAFYTIPSENNEFRLCFATYPEPILTEGIKRLAKAFELVKKSKTTEPFVINPMKPIV